MTTNHNNQGSRKSKRKKKNMSKIVWKDMKIHIMWNQWKKRTKEIRNLVSTWRVRVAAILKLQKRYSTIVIMQHRLQSMVGPAAHLDCHCRYRKELTFCILICTLRSFKGAFFFSNGLDRRLRSLIIGCGYSNHSSHHERSCLLGSG